MGDLWTIDDMAAAMVARCAGALPEAITGISIDSRTIKPGEAFFAIKGDAHNGHDFVAAAVRAKAGVAVVSNRKRAGVGKDASAPTSARLRFDTTATPAFARSAAVTKS